ncbi:MAG: hypothetical protein M1821_002684 [Bathelium mastoideum]|nr:MAG: hypothetical protein M1821_002684 [Bathelium mastoideum]
MNREALYPINEMQLNESDSGYLTSAPSASIGDRKKGSGSLESAPEDNLEPIAVVGMAFRGPQEAESPSTLWDAIVKKRSLMTELPKNRFNQSAFCDNENPRMGILNVRGGHFMQESPSAFDAPFFSISSEEASSMDPQQRWLLEAGYEALENAGIPIETASGSRTAVYVGSFFRDYELMLLRDPQMHVKYRATGVGLAMLANRLSWYFDFHGPSFLRAGEADMALAGGCNFILNPDTMTSMTDMGFLSPDDKCYSFDERANGYSRGEGVGLVVLKRLTDALQNGDTLRGIIRATGVNQDGKTPSITQPSSTAQEQLILDTYNKAGLDLEETRFFEAHGTGTAVGDPLEAHAIYKAFEKPLSDHPIYVGAVK